MKYFSFGQNWKDFIDKNYSEERLTQAIKSLQDFLKIKDLKSQTFLDIGCGSGLFSLAAYKLGAAKIISFDLDPFSVQCAEILRDKENKPSNWEVYTGSILDEEFLKKISSADIVYSWGVLHHTGNMWKAIDNAAQFIKPNGGVFFIAIYNKVNGIFGSTFWLNIKKIYNYSPKFIKLTMEMGYMLADCVATLLTGKNPIKKIKNYTSRRGMSWRTDVTDWLGGYPYEFATAQEIEDYCRDKLNLKHLKTNLTPSLGNNEFLFIKKV